MEPYESLIEFRDITKAYGRGTLVDSNRFVLGPVSIEARAGEVVGILGESGSGKSTVANLILRLTSPTSGSYRFRGRDVAAFSRAESFAFKSNVQMVFQDPYGSLNPRATIGFTIREALILHRRDMSRSEMDDRVRALLEEVGLGNEDPRRYPHEFSGGQRQRIAIARALAVEPELLVCDEPLSSLDVSIQAQILELFASLIAHRQLTMIFISHDLNVSRLLCDRVYMMYQGKVVEEGEAEQVLSRPGHEYTARLLAAVY